MLLNFAGTSHWDSQCNQSLCFHICRQLWSGRCPIDMAHILKSRKSRRRVRDGETHTFVDCWETFWSSGSVFFFFWYKTHHVYTFYLSEASMVKGKRQPETLTAGRRLPSQWHCEDARHIKRYARITAAHGELIGRAGEAKKTKQNKEKKHSRLDQKAPKHQRRCHAARIVILVFTKRWKLRQKLPSWTNI